MSLLGSISKAEEGSLVDRSPLWAAPPNVSWFWPQKS
jgi:hypothetical protein